MNNLADMRTSLQKTLIETVSKDDRVLALIDTNHKKIAKPLSETRINNKLVGEEIHVGEHVASFKESIDTVEAEVASLWDQWEIAQNQVDSIFVELASAQDGVSDGGQTCAVAAVKESLAKEMDKLEDELSAILEEAHEEARASEKVFWNSAVLMCALADFSGHLELQQEDQRGHVCPAATVLAGRLRFPCRLDNLCGLFRSEGVGGDWSTLALVSGVRN